MKGIILCGGTGTRLRPSSYILNKHLFNVWNKPLIEYPLETLKKMGVDDFLIVTGSEHVGDFSSYFRRVAHPGLSFTYRTQEEAGGIAQALGLAEDFVKGQDRFPVILGDNIFENTFKMDLKFDCTLFYKEIEDPRRFGVLEKDKIVEKPEQTDSKKAIVGLYVYNRSVFSYIKFLKPSARGEYEITDVNNFYLQGGNVKLAKVRGFWSDAGTHESMFKAAEWARNKGVDNLTCNPEK
jgi:glucose-1-phosphate thymidylyltransferase